MSFEIFVLNQKVRVGAILKTTFKKKSLLYYNTALLLDISVVINNIVFSLCFSSACPILKL